ncbi:MAG: type I-C CRISPR-associated protein Cas8c/Csd1, partial [Sphaerospermopsis kisseleviana]
MLSELDKLGKFLDSQKLLSPYGYDVKNVNYQIDLSSGSITSLETPRSKGQPVLGKKLLVPDLLRNGEKPLLIDDSAEYLFGAGERGQKRQPLYLELLQQCINATEHEAVKKVYEYVTSTDSSEIFRQLKELNPKVKEDWVKSVFVFLLDGEQVTNIPVIKEWWVKKANGDLLTLNTGTQGRCLISGEEHALVLKTVVPIKIKGVPNTQSAGAALVSFDKEVTESYGLVGNANASISLKSGVRTHITLNFLLRSPNNRYKIENQVFLYWGEENGEGINPEVWDNPSLETIFSAPNKPQNLNIEELEESRFFIACLTGNAGRISLSSWDETTLSQVKSSLRRFVEVQLNCATKASPVWLLVKCAFGDGKDNYKSRIAGELTKFALLGSALSDGYAQKIISRICAERQFSYVKAQGLYLYLASNNMNYPTGQLTLDSAFKLGRISFLFHFIHHKSQNLSEDKTVVMKNLKVLSSTPYQVFAKISNHCMNYHLENVGFIKPKLTEEFKDFDITNLPDFLDTKSQAL